VSDSSFDAFTRHASLISLGAAGMAAAAHPFAAAGKKKGKNRKKGDVNKLCKTQVEPCISIWMDTCGSDPLCQLTTQRCCQFFGTCDTTGFWTCLLGAAG
jgi:hypothetical protein